MKPDIYFVKAPGPLSIARPERISFMTGFGAEFELSLGSGCAHRDLIHMRMRNVILHFFASRSNLVPSKGSPLR